MTTDSAFVENSFSDRCVHNKYIIDQARLKVDCALCHKELNPVWVLMQFRNQENRLRMSISKLEQIKERAEKKNRCKCEHCNQMTRIER